MSNKHDEITIEYVLKFSRRFCYIFLSLCCSLFVVYILDAWTYGFNKEGKMYHSYLDYPNEIISEEAIELSTFISNLHKQWKSDARIYYSLDNQLTNASYWAKEIDLKNPTKKRTLLQRIAQDFGLSPHPTIPLPSSSDLVTRKIKGGPPRKNIAIPNNMEQLTLENDNQCNDQRLQFKTTKSVSFLPKDISRLSVHLDGVFHESGTISIHKAPTHAVVFNLTLYGQSERVLSHVSFHETHAQESKTISIHNRHPSTFTSCLTYHIDLVFPHTLETFDTLDLRVNHARLISGDLEGILFRRFVAGLGRGVIHLEHLKADHILLGNLNGMIQGSYAPYHTMGAATVEGTTSVTVSPQTKYTRSTLVALYGPVKTISTVGGKFLAHCWLCKPSIIANTSVHLLPFRRKAIKIGTIGNRDDGSKIQLHSIQGETKLIYT